MFINDKAKKKRFFNDRFSFNYIYKDYYIY